ncbi:hypothetical protein VTK73DRAFT_1898 [Phialemonium thermophilum]|uniref:Uncharacterized protein n=1 Tax=Phialemonium thermophilum TaxID=223376 RepID=A0ABR3Y263_9PEZI
MHITAALLASLVLDAAQGTSQLNSSTIITVTNGVTTTVDLSGFISSSTAKSSAMLDTTVALQGPTSTNTVLVGSGMTTSTDFLNPTKTWLPTTSTPSSLLLATLTSSPSLSDTGPNTSLILTKTSGTKGIFSAADPVTNNLTVTSPVPTMSTPSAVAPTAAAADRLVLQGPVLSLVVFCFLSLVCT